MESIGFYCDAQSIEANALQQLEQYAQKPYVDAICAFTDIHFCQEKALPVGVAFRTKDIVYPLITGKDIGCGVMYLKVEKSYWQKPFDKKAHYAALNFAHQQMTDDGLGGGNHFLSIEEDEESVFIICHTGTRDRGIALYQQCLQLTKDYSRASGTSVDYVHRDFLNADFIRYYNETLEFGYTRRKNFCLKTLVFLQNANYIRANKLSIAKDYLRRDYKVLENTGTINGTPYILEDSVHNHLRFQADQILHRKGSTELVWGKTVVIPLSMSRGSLLVRLAGGGVSGSGDKSTQAEGGAPTSQAGADYSPVSALWSCSHGAGRRLSRYDAMKHWKTVLKEKERRQYKDRFSELLGRNGEFPNGYVQEFDFAYKDASDIFRYQPHLKKVTQTRPIVTIKYTEI